MLISQNDQAHSNNSSAICRWIECVWPFVGLALKALKNARKMTFLLMLNCHAVITLMMTNKLMTSKSRFLVETKMNPFVLSRLQKKTQLKKILLTHMVTLMVIVKGFWKDFIWNCQDRRTLGRKKFNYYRHQLYLLQISFWYLRRHYSGSLFRCSTFQTYDSKS